MTYRRLNSLRMKGFDYSQRAYYLITLGVEDKLPILGEVKNSKMILSPLGQLVDDTWKNIPAHYQNTKLHRHQVMPDHFHGIIEITKADPENASVSRIINQFKGSVSKQAKATGISTPKILWQRSFWCKVFWMFHDLVKIEKYIEDNPRNYNLH